MDTSNSINHSLISPPGAISLPQGAEKRSHTNGDMVKGQGREGSAPVDADALSKALKDFEDAGRTRERTPGGSPSRKRQRVYGDRFV